MDSVAPPSPIQIHIPPNLAPLAIPLSTWLSQNPAFANLCVGACIFARPTHGESTSATPRLLLVQRASTERGFPNRWEVPGGSAEAEDPTILHSVAREVFEETGLRLKSFVRKIGFEAQFNLGPNRLCKKLSFQIGVVEDVTGDGEFLSRLVSKSCDLIRVDAPTVELNPEEHRAFKWVTAEELKEWGPANVVSKDQMQTMLQAFEGCHHEARCESHHSG